MEQAHTHAARGLARAAEGQTLRLWLAALVALLLLSATLAVAVGPIAVPPGDVWRIAAFKAGLGEPGGWARAHENIVWLIRLPRALLAALVGAGLAAVGVTMQATVRNPLADPYLLGISSGASVGAVLAIGSGAFAFAGRYAVSLGAFCGALASFALVFALARQHGQIAPQRLILAGVGVAYVGAGITSLLTLTSANRALAGQMLAWTLGSLARASWLDLTLPALVLLAGAAYLLAQGRGLNALLAGDETAATLGVDVERLRRRLFVVTALLTGVMVAVSGAVGFVGLVAPHMVRLAVGADHRRVLPVALLAGSVFLIWVDTLARTAFAPVELPVGVVTALLGGPFFLWLMWRQGRAGGAR